MPTDPKQQKSSAGSGDGWSDRVFVVTGAKGNLGRAVIATLLERGAKVCGIVRRFEEVLELESIVRSDRLRVRAASLTDQTQIEAAFSAASELGPIWGLVHTAGAWAGGAPVAETEPAIFEQMIDANLRSAFLCARAAMQRMVKSGGGRIALVSAYTAHTGIGGGDNAAYAISKAGVIALVKALAEEGAAKGVRANCVAPGTIQTPQNAKARPSADVSKWVPLAEVVAAALALCAPGELGVNGSVLALPTR